MRASAKTLTLQRTSGAQTRYGILKASGVQARYGHPSPSRHCEGRSDNEPHVTYGDFSQAFEMTVTESRVARLRA